MTPEKLASSIPMMPRTGLLLGNVNGSQCIIWDDPAIQVKREISGLPFGKLEKMQRFTTITTSSHVLFIWGVYTKCSANFRVSSPDLIWKTLVERMEHAIEFIAVEECCGNSMKFLKMLYIYQMCLFSFWRLHANVPDALASFFHDLISKFCIKVLFPIVNHLSPESF